jgi:hypothetical protein
VDGSESEQCDEFGKCVCRLNVVGDKCDTCADGYATFPDCDQCAALYYEEKPPCLGANPEYKGDGYCDDDLNNENCEYDGGDCCLNPKKH